MNMQLLLIHNIIICPYCEHCPLCPWCNIWIYIKYLNVKLLKYWTFKREQMAINDKGGRNAFSCTIFLISKSILICIWLLVVILILKPHIIVWRKKVINYEIWKPDKTMTHEEQKLFNTLFEYHFKFIQIVLIHILLRAYQHEC